MVWPLLPVDDDTFIIGYISIVHTHGSFVQRPLTCSSQPYHGRDHAFGRAGKPVFLRNPAEYGKVLRVRVPSRNELGILDTQKCFAS
jgi:hypothetical protein